MRRRPVLIALGSIVLTALVVLLIANFSLGDKQVDQRIEPLYGTHDPQFVRTQSFMLGPPILNGNRASVLVNGVEIFPAMLEAIRSARRTITFETYIYWAGDIGKEFAEALSDRARAGVKVHVLLDWIGSEKLDAELLESMKRAGVEVERYNPAHWYNLWKVNHRTHRKLLVIDGSVGFTGGVGIADNWQGDARNPDQWRDTHFRLEGPAVGQMQAAFMDNWVQVTGNVLHGPDYFPQLDPVGPHGVEIFTSAPGGGAESMQLMYLLSIAAARQSIQLSAAYFVPDNVAINMLVDALRRGVKVQIIVPGPHIDTEVVRRASRASWGKLLRAGAEIYEYQPTMFHCKVMVVDDIWTSVGSTNFDTRSFSVNDEANMNVYDVAFAKRQREIFEQDLSRSRRVSLKEWEQRPLLEKALERTADLFSSQL